MLEELLSERDEMEARHAEEIAQREAQVAAGEEERGLLRSELDTLKKRIDEKQRRMKDASQQAVQTKAVQQEAQELREKLQDIREAHTRDVARLQEVKDRNRANYEGTAAADMSAHECDREVKADIQDEDTNPASQSGAPDLAYKLMATPARPCIKAPGNKRRHTARLSFSSVLVREFEQELGGGGGLPSEGSPIGLGWAFQDQGEVEMDAYEGSRQGVRRERQEFMTKGYLTPIKRYKRLCELGFDDEDIERELDTVREVIIGRNSSNEELEQAEKMQVLGQAFMWWWMCANNLVET